MIVLFLDLNLLDWSSDNFLAVCLGPCVYLWNADTGDIHQLLEMENPDEYVSSVSWIKEGNHLAVGTSTSEVQVLKYKLLKMWSGWQRQPESFRISNPSWSFKVRRNLYICIP